MVLVGSQWLLVVLVASQWFSVVLLVGSRRFSMVLVGYQKSGSRSVSVVLCCSYCFS